VMSDKRQFLPARLGRTDIHMTVYLSAVSAYYLSIKILSQTKSQPALAYTSRTNYSYQMIHLV